jgi:hypothetical protein
MASLPGYGFRKSLDLNSPYPTIWIISKLGLISQIQNKFQAKL